MQVVTRRLALIIFVGSALLSVSACATSTAKRAVVLPTPTKGGVSLAIDSPSYKLSQPIGVTVANGTKATYFARTDETDCTFLQLQEFDTKSNQWLRIGPCASPNLITTYQIPAGVVEPLTLPPGIPGDSAHLNSWPAGEYRVALLYSDAATGGHILYAFSPGFVIH